MLNIIKLRLKNIYKKKALNNHSLALNYKNFVPTVRD